MFSRTLKPVASAPHQPCASVRSGSSAATSSLLPCNLLLFGLGAVVTGMVSRKLYRIIVCPVPHDCVGVVFNCRRRTVFSSSVDSENKIFECSTITRKSFMSSVGFLSVARKLLFPTTCHYVTKPPLPFFKMFLLPRAVVLRSAGASCTCRVVDVRTPDGLASIQLTVRYFLATEDLQRYLSVIGPGSPSGKIGNVIAFCTKGHAAHIGYAELRNSRKRDTYFMPGFSPHLASKLYSDCAVTLLSVVVDTVEFEDDA
eukprot:Tbor_TRINITY_DN8555_c0_g1::TRINITY_DN8555_c0_g1_i1::g.18145::m.18145